MPDAPPADAQVRTAIAQDGTPLRPADPEDVLFALTFALTHEGRHRTHQADHLAAGIAAERLVEHLQRSGFVVTQKPPLPASR